MSHTAFRLTVQVHADLKRSLALWCPGISAANRAEALACGLGFRTNAALHAALGETPSVRACLESFLGFLGPKAGDVTANHLGMCLEQVVFPALNNAGTPRWLLMPNDPDGNPAEAWPHYVPHVCAKGQGMARAIVPEGFVKEGCGLEEAFRAFAHADQYLFELRPHSGPDAPWNRMFWPGRKDDGILKVDDDGIPIRWVYAGMGHWLLDLGVYDGGRPWPDTAPGS